MDLVNDLRIDESALDVEWLGQAALMGQYVVLAAETRMEMDKAKERLDLAKAELDKDIRMDPDKYDVSKITEGVVLTTVLMQAKYKEASDAFIEAKYEYECAMGAVRAIEHRKTALENLVRLNGQSYFAGPSVPRNLAEEVELKQGRTNRKMVERRKRTK